ncbi:hypothetical protein HON59_01580 [bacterium]|jgi:hypothetical protein|nr:hypothetical protein [bacterium]MBT3729759.1 hypothetical protein [bacterium]MBT4894734.1 hypothetical protein [bacterium]
MKNKLSIFLLVVVVSLFSFSQVMFADDVSDLRQVLKTCEGEIEARGYVGTYESQSPIKINYSFGDRHCGALYVNYSGEDVHVLGHYLGEDKELITQFLQLSGVTKEQILKSFPVLE